jgi:hypothetical protein
MYVLCMYACMYDCINVCTYKASVSPCSVEQIMPYYLLLLLLRQSSHLSGSTNELKRSSLSFIQHLGKDHAENTAFLLLRRRVYSPLHSNGSYSIVACVFVAGGMCLPSSCLAMDISDFTILAFGRHVTICFRFLSINISYFIQGLQMNEIK